MCKLPPLTPRLQLTAEFVRAGVKVADIGTDHAYLPVWLIKSGKCSGAVASDINSGPIKRAASVIEKYHAGDSVLLHQGSGLSGIRPEDAEDIVVAGMGGELIFEIIRSCGWVKNPEKHLVLQPMTAQSELRKNLSLNGFEIEKEDVAKEGRKLYLVMSVKFTGKICIPDEAFCMTGKLPQSGGSLAGEWIERQSQKLIKKAEGLKKSKTEQKQIGDIEKLAESLHQISLQCENKPVIIN